MLNVGLFTSLGVNVGDEFIREGIRAILEAAGASYTPLYVNKHDSATLFTSVEDESLVVRDKYAASDIFIQCGAPVYWRLFHGRVSSLTSEWHEWLYADRVLPGGEGPLFINLGAGSCQPWGEGADFFLADPECSAFAAALGQRSALTIVRDPVAHTILERLNVAHHAIPCPAFLAGARHPIRQAWRPGVIGVNLMPLGAHYDLTEQFDKTAWRRRCRALCAALRPLGRLVFIAHDAAERAFASLFAAADERIFQGGDFRTYFDMYSACDVVVANRVHGAVMAAGLGVPGLIMGNDTRAQIGDYMKLPRFCSADLDPQEVAAQARLLQRQRTDESERLLALRTSTLQNYIELMAPALALAAGRRQRASRPSAPAPVQPAARLASVRELESPAFQDFMAQLNAFSRAHGLMERANWSSVWEYPWLWRHALSSVDWTRTHLVDIGAGLSSLPWFLATLGAQVTLIETDPGSVEVWQRLRRQLQVEVEWHFVDGEQLPLASESADLVTSLSVLEHQRDQPRAIEEAARVLRPGGLFALSFDICEPELGMTFPAWNGHPLTMRKFENMVWGHAAFGNNAGPGWNNADIESFKQWHLQSAAHHNYVVGAAVLRKITQ